MADYDLKTALNNMRGKSFNFALYKGKKDNQVLVTAKPPSTTQVTALEKECGEVTRVAKGICRHVPGEGTEFSTRLAPPPSLLASLTKLFRERGCAKFLPVFVKQLGPNESDEVHEVDSTDAQSGGNVQGQEVPPADLAQQFATLKAELTPLIKAAVAANPPNKDAILQQVSAAMAMEKAGDFAGGIQAFNALRPLLSTTAPQPTTSQTTPPQEPPQPPKTSLNAATLTAAFDRIVPTIKQAVIAHPNQKDALLRPVAAFQAHIKAGQLDEAKQTLGSIATQLKSLGGAGGNNPEAAKAWTLAKEAWRVAIETVDGQLNKLHSAMIATGDADLKIIADKGLPALTDNHKTPVMRVLFEVDQTQGDARKQAAAKGLAAVTAFRTHITSDPRVKVMDEDAPRAFGSPLTIRQSIGAGLDALEGALKPMAA